MAAPAAAAPGGAGVAVQYLSFSYLLGALLMLALVIGPILYMFFRYVMLTLRSVSVGVGCLVVWKECCGLRVSVVSVRCLVGGARRW